MMKIDAVVYSYKNKNLPNVVDTLIKNTKSNITVYVFDQHPILRDKLFTQSNVKYEHIFWDYITSPCIHKQKIIKESNADYVLIMSDDILVKDGWDESLINFVDKHDHVVSGAGKLSITKKDLFSFKKDYEEFNSFMYSAWVDRNFIFGKLEHFNKIEYPVHLKYFGEEEYLSAAWHLENVKVYTAPSKTYQDLSVRTIENLYVPYSTEHNYNSVVDLFKNTDGLKHILDCYNIDINNWHRLPYERNDVSYDAFSLEFDDVDSTRYVAKVSAIY